MSTTDWPCVGANRHLYCFAAVIVLKVIVAMQKTSVVLGDITRRNRAVICRYSLPALAENLRRQSIFTTEAIYAPSGIYNLLFASVEEDGTDWEISTFISGYSLPSLHFIVSLAAMVERVRMLKSLDIS